MLSKLSLFVFIAFAIGTCETPEYHGAKVVGTYTYDGKDYEIVSMAYDTESSQGSGYFLFAPSSEKYVRYYPHQAAAGCLDTSLEDCRIKFGQQLRAASKAARDEGGMY